MLDKGKGEGGEARGDRWPISLSYQKQSGENMGWAAISRHGVAGLMVLTANFIILSKARPMAIS